MNEPEIASLEKIRKPSLNSVAINRAANEKIIE